MKKLLGVDIEGSAVLTPGITGVGKVTFSGLDLELNQILIITNISRNTIIYNFASTSAGVSSFSNNELVLIFDTSTYSSNDILQVFVDISGEKYPVPIDMSPKSWLSVAFSRIMASLASPVGYAQDTKRYRATTLIESGTVTTVSTVSTVTTVTTVTTCSTVTNIAQLGGLAADRLVLNQNYSAWASTVRARIT